MVYDMEQNQFPLDLDNVHSVVEVGQVCVFSIFLTFISTHTQTDRVLDKT